MDWKNFTDRDWKAYADAWLNGLNNPDADDTGQSILMLNFIGAAEDNWKFIKSALDLAETDDELGHLAAGPRGKVI